MKRQELYLGKEGKILKAVVGVSEDDLKQFIWHNQKMFQENKFIFITKEFHLKGSRGDSGSIDILAFDSVKKRFVIFELKLGFDKGAIHQAKDYRRDILKNFGQVYLDAKKYTKELPDDTQIDQKAVDIIVIAKRFNEKQFEQADDKKSGITLIKYYWFENDILLLDYVHDACDVKIGAEFPGGIKKYTKAEIEKMPLDELLNAWNDLVNYIQRPNSKKDFRNPKPNSKENIDKLRKLFPKSLEKKTKAKYNAYHNLLDGFVKNLEKQE